MVWSGHGQTVYCNLCRMWLTRLLDGSWKCVCCDFETPRDPCPHRKRFDE